MKSEQNKEKDVVTVNNDVINAVNDPKQYALLKQKQLMQIKNDCKWLRVEVEYLELLARKAEAMAKVDYYSRKEEPQKQEAEDNARKNDNTTTENK